LPDIYCGLVGSDGILRSTGVASTQPIAFRFQVAGQDWLMVSNLVKPWGIEVEVKLGDGALQRLHREVFPARREVSRICHFGNLSKGSSELRVTGWNSNRVAAPENQRKGSLTIV
jgi:hypothetical protein